MCFDLDSRPPIAPDRRRALDHDVARPDRPTTATGSWRSGRARPSRAGPGSSSCPTSAASTRTTRSSPSGSRRPASMPWRSTTSGGPPGIDTPRDDSSSTRRTSPQTTWAGHHGRRPRGGRRGPGRTATGSRSLFTIGFCLGGRAAFVTPTLGLGPGRRDRLLRVADRATGRNGTPIPADDRVGDGGRGARPVRRRRHRASRPRRSRRSTRPWRTPASTTGSSPTTARRTASSTARPPISPRRAPRPGPRSSGSSGRGPPDGARSGAGDDPPAGIARLDDPDRARAGPNPRRPR